MTTTNNFLCDFAHFYIENDLPITKLKEERESQEYKACTFNIYNRKIISRKAKITPKKIGQFVTLWQRNENGITQPFHEDTAFDFCVITVKKDTLLGQFIFPKSILIKKGILTTPQKEGKRGFRVYPLWDTPTSKQAQKTQQWQLTFFINITEKQDALRLKNLYQAN